jgi:predicted phosphoribosyltransferase
MITSFKDRIEAGRLLAAKLADYANRDDVVVLALPRGGLPVGYEVAKALKAPLDVFVVRKLGVPGHEELAMGAIASGDVRVLNQEVVESLGIFQRTIDAVAAEEQKELERRERAYRGGHRRLDIEGRVVLLVDDGIATGSTMRAAAAAVRQKHPKKVVVAVPTAAASTLYDFDSMVDEVVAVMTPEHFYGVGQWYEDFSQTSDEEVRDILDRAQSLCPKGSDEG